MALRRAPTPKTLVRGEEVTAAVDLNLANREDQLYAKSTAAYSRQAGTRPWKWFDNIGEVHYAISRSARIAGYTQLKCVELNENGEIGKDVDDGLAADIVRGIYSPFGGVRGLVDRFYTLMKVPADSYLLEVLDADGDPDGYHFLSADELDLTSFSRWKPGKAHIKWVTVPSTAGTEQGSRFVREVDPQQLLGRIWSPSRRYVDLTDSALTALDTECETLYLLTKTIKAKLMSRFSMAGLFFLPNSISTARVTKNQEQIAGQNVDQTLNFLINSMTRNVKNWEDATTYMPILLKGNADDGDKIRHIVMDREIFETDIELRRELIQRILQGLDSNQDTTKGTADQNHFCLDEQAEIMTLDGWRKHGDLTEDDFVLTLNHETGCSEWNVVQKINRFDVTDEVMVELSTATHHSLSTLNHRWPVKQRTTEAMKDGHYPRWRTSESLNTGSQIVVAAPSAHQPQEPKWSDAFVEVLGWFWTEGTCGRYEPTGKHNISIVQSTTANPQMVARIRRALTDLYGPASDSMMGTKAGPRGSSHHSAKLSWDDVVEIRVLLDEGSTMAAIADSYGVSESAISSIKQGRSWAKGDTLIVPAWSENLRANGMAVFSLNQAASEPIIAVAPDRVVGMGWVRELTSAQLELFIQVSVWADGHTAEGGQRWVSQKREEMLDAVELAAILSGYRVTRSSSESQGFNWRKVHTLYIGSKTVVDFQKGGIGRTKYSGVVWCPTTKNSTWLARRNGKAFYTGNSAWAATDEERRVAVQPDLEMLSWALTRLVLHKKLQETGMAPSEIVKYGVWFDLSKSSVHANQQEDARQLFDRGLISDEATRRMSGVGDEDVIDDKEYVRWVGKQTKNPVLMMHGLKENKKIDWEEVKAFPGTPGPAEDSSAEDSEAGPGGGGSDGSPDKIDTDTPRKDRPA